MEDFVSNTLLPSSVVEKNRAAKVALHRAVRKREDKRMAPSTAGSAVDDVIHAMWVPVETSTTTTSTTNTHSNSSSHHTPQSFVVGALPNGIISIMNAHHMQKIYLFYDEPKKISSSTSKSYSSSKKDDIKKTATESTVPQSSSSGTLLDDSKEGERRRRLNTVAICKLDKGGFLCTSVLDEHVIVYRIDDFNSSKLCSTITKTSGHHRAVPLPEGSWKRVSAMFNPTGDKLLVVLRSSSSSLNAATSSSTRFCVVQINSTPQGGNGKDHHTSNSGVLSVQVLTDWKELTSAAGHESQSSHDYHEQPSLEVVAMHWLNSSTFVVLDRRGNVVVFTLAAVGSSGGVVQQVGVCQLPILHFSITSGCFFNIASAPNATPLTSASVVFLSVAMDATLIETFQIAVEKQRVTVNVKRDREDDVVSVRHEQKVEINATLVGACNSGDFRIHGLSFVSITQPQLGVPVVTAVLETGGIVAYHALNLELLYHYAYSRVSDDESVRLSLLCKEKPLQFCVIEGGSASVLKPV